MNNIGFQQFILVFLSRLDIEVSCYGYEGIDAVKHALKAGLAKSTEDEPIKVAIDIFFVSV